MLQDTSCSPCVLLINTLVSDSYSLCFLSNSAAIWLAPSWLLHTPMHCGMGFSVLFFNHSLALNSPVPSRCPENNSESLLGPSRLCRTCPQCRLWSQFIHFSSFAHSVLALHWPFCSSSHMHLAYFQFRTFVLGIHFTWNVLCQFFFFFLYPSLCGPLYNVIFLREISLTTLSKVESPTLVLCPLL